ncbi:MAG: hypothetical protein ABII00_02955 [Elusimicrobiota bacterium]
MTNPPPRRGSGINWLLALFPIIVLSVLVWFFVSRRGEEPQTAPDQYSAFNLAEAPEEASSRPGDEYVSRFEKRSQERMGGSARGPGLAGFVPETGGAYRKDRKGDGRFEREREEEMIKKYDPMIRKEVKRLSRITKRYHKKHAVVREVDRAFGKLPRYMALREQYLKDRNAYDFVRGAIALPEVRRLIRKYSLDVDVWKVALGMSSEAMKQKPPKPLYDEIVRFFTTDKKVSKFVADWTNWMMPNMGKMVTRAVPPGADLSALTSLGTDLNPAGAASMSTTSGRKSSRRTR